MKMLSRIVMAGALVWGVGAAYAVAQDYEGQLVIYNKPEASGQYEKVNCTIPFKTSTINFQNNDLGCGNDDAYAFKLDNVPSATYFAFYDDPACSDSGNFAYRFKTIKHPTNMITPASILTAGSGVVGEVVTGSPGVMLVSSYRKGGDADVDGKLSCVKIERSEVPGP